MKKNLPISLMILCTVFVDLPGKTSYQNLLLQHGSPSRNVTEENESSQLIAGLSPYKLWTKKTDAGVRISWYQANDFYDDQVSGNNKKGDEMIINQVSREGIVLVRLYFEFTKFSGKKLGKYQTISVSQKTGG